MGVDCKLLPIEHDAGSWGYSHSMIQLGRVYAFYEKLRKLPDAGPVPERFSCFLSRVPDGKKEGEYGYGDCQKDPYGEKLRCVYAGDLGGIKLPKTADPSIKAAVAYCRALEPKMRIALFWH